MDAVLKGCVCLILRASIYIVFHIFLNDVILVNIHNNPVTEYLLYSACEKTLALITRVSNSSPCHF